MLIRIAPGDPGPTAVPQLLEPDDFGAFKVVVAAGVSGEVLDAVVNRIGRPHDDHVYVDPSSLRELAGERASDAEWVAGLAAMTGYASKHGWVDGSGWIRAHVETESESSSDRG